jgi:hypothetical protein
LSKGLKNIKAIIGAIETPINDPIETILVKKAMVMPIAKQIKDNIGFITSITPMDDAIPLPPLNLRATGQLCPIIKKIPPIY